MTNLSRNQREANSPPKRTHARDPAAERCFFITANPRSTWSHSARAHCRQRSVSRCRRPGFITFTFPSITAGAAMREIAAKLCRRLSRYVRARVLYLPTRKRGSRRCGGGDDTVMSNKEGAEGKPHPGNERPTNLRRRGYRSRVSGRGAVAGPFRPDWPPPVRRRSTGTYFW